MDEKSIELLEFPRVREILASHAESPGGARLALAMRPLADYGQVTRRLSQSREARRLLDTEPNTSLGEVKDITETARKARLGVLVEPKDLLQVATTLTSLRQLRQKLAETSHDFPALWKLGKEISEFPELEKAIRKCIQNSGEITDTASPTLASLRRQVQGARQHILKYLKGVITSHRMRNFIQDEIVTERYGRYVIPIKAECQHRIKGIVHDISNTGATVFMEPSSAIEMGNELRGLEIAEKHEVARILEALSSQVGEHYEDIAHNLEIAAELDLALAKGRYAARSGAIEPEIIDPDGDGDAAPAHGGLRLVSARHPLLGDHAVPLTLDIGDEFSTLVITGPNMGGKTVALKTIGLLSLMAISGMPVPASSGTRIPIFDNIFSDIGDEQSIEQTVSTFSWHISNIVRFLESVTPLSLVLLDELGSSTDPAEGSALARSILKYLLSRGVTTVATSHHNDLKAFAYMTDGMQNAAMEFDPVTQQPTYRLQTGIPGGSNALATAARLGLLPEITGAAKRLLSDGDQELQALLSHLREERANLRRQLAELEKEQREIEERRAGLEAGFERLERHRLTVVQETRDRVLAEAAELHQEIKKAAAELRRQKSEERLAQARKTISEVRQSLNRESWVPDKKETADGEPVAAPLAPGDFVSVRGLNLQGKVLSIFPAAHELELQTGQSKLRISLDSVTRETATPEAAPASHPMLPATPPVSLELDLRGKRAYEIEATLDSYLNDASLAGLGKVRIIHGFGTGAVRSIVRDFLTVHPLVSSFRPGGKDEGGDGVTVAEF